MRERDSKSCLPVRYRHCWRENRYAHVEELRKLVRKRRENVEKAGKCVSKVVVRRGWLLMTEARNRHRANTKGDKRGNRLILSLARTPNFFGQGSNNYCTRMTLRSERTVCCVLQTCPVRDGLFTLIPTNLCSVVRLLQVPPQTSAITFCVSPHAVRSFYRSILGEQWCKRLRERPLEQQLTSDTVS